MAGKGEAQAGGETAAAATTQSGAVSIEEALNAALEGVEETGATAEGTEATEATEATAQAEAAEETEATEPEQHEEQFEEGELPGVRAETQEKINKRIGKVTAKRKEAEEAAQAALAKAEEAEKRATEAESRLKDSELKEAFALGIHPSYLTKDELAVLKQDRELAKGEAWLLDHFDGYEGTDEKTDPSYSAKQIRTRYREIQEQRRPIAARAELLRSERLQQMLADMEAGRKLRLGGKAPSGAEPAAAAPVKKALPKPPALPGAGGSAAGKPPVSATKPSAAFDAKRVMDAGGGKEALAQELENLL